MWSGQTTDLGAGLGTAHVWCDSMRSGQTTDLEAGLGTAHDGVTVCGVDILQTSGQVLEQLMMV